MKSNCKFLYALAAFVTVKIFFLSIMFGMNGEIFGYQFSTLAKPDGITFSTSLHPVHHQPAADRVDAVSDLEGIKETKQIEIISNLAANEHKHQTIKRRRLARVFSNSPHRAQNRPACFRLELRKGNAIFRSRLEKLSE